MSDFCQPWPCFDNRAVFLCCGIFSGINTPVFATSALKRKVLFKHSSEMQFKEMQHLRCEERSLWGEPWIFKKAAWCRPTDHLFVPDVEARRYL